MENNKVLMYMQYNIIIETGNCCELDMNNERQSFKLTLYKKIFMLGEQIKIEL